MSSFAGQNDEEIGSLRRQVKALSSELASARSEHLEEMRTKEQSIFAGFSKREKLQKLNAQYKAEKLELEVSVKAHSTAASAAEAENRHLNTEVKRLCKLTECLKRRITELENELATRPDLTLRMRIKLLCKKYHADKCGVGAAFTGEEVSRDLVALLSDEYGVR